MLADLEPFAAEKHWNQAWSIHQTTAAEASFQRRKDMLQVLETFRIEAESKPWDWYAQANYGLVLLEIGRPRQALDPLRLAVKLAPEKDGIHFHLARAMAQGGMRNEALMILQRLLQQLPACTLRRDVEALRARLTASDG
jgi:tetratricopeptide (TPR) repeat protein